MNNTISPLLLILLTIALLLTVYYSYNHFIDDRKNQRTHELELIKEDNNAKVKTALVNAISIMSEQKIKHLKLTNEIVNPHKHTQRGHQ